MIFVVFMDGQLNYCKTQIVGWYTFVTVISWLWHVGVETCSSFYVCCVDCVVFWVWRSKSCTPVLTERLVTEGNWYEAPAGHLRIDIHESNHNSWREE